MDIINLKVNEYINGLLPERNEILKEMESYAREKKFPIIGPQVGRLLYQLSYLKKPETIFECGSGFGYSSFWFLSGYPDCFVTCTELDHENIQKGNNWLERGGFSGHFKFIQKDALNILRNSPEFYDIILNDAHKTQYPEIFKAAVKHLKPGGLLLTDNLLWSGRVADSSDNSAEVKAIHEYNEMIFNTPGLFSTLLPIRDGVGLSIKLS